MVLRLLFFVLFFNIYPVKCIRNSSLTFVIDDTRSMYDDIDQVRVAAEEIMKVVIEEKSSEIEDVLLVTFNDPEVEFRGRMSKSYELKQALDNITTHNFLNDDCPEYALSGIELALKESRPNSYLFVFTDASAKDFYKVNEIRNLCEKKQSQVVFVLTGDCYAPYSPQYKVYSEIAQACSGQVFRVPKEDVKYVISTIRETVRGQKTVLIWKILPQSYNLQPVKFAVDDKTDYVIISTSGVNVDLHVTDSLFDGRRIPYDRIMWNRRGKVVKLNNLSPREYYAWVRGDSDISIVVYARTDISFEHGFSEMVPKSLAHASKQPIAGRSEHLSISVTDPELAVVIKTAKIVDMNGATLIELPLIRKYGDFYYTDKFVAPTSMFKIMITGTVNGNYIQRTSRTAIEPQAPPKVLIKPKAPEVKIIEGVKVDVDYNGGITLTCKASAYPAPKIVWTMEGGTLLNSTSFEVELPYDYISYQKLSHLKSSGTYYCRASNRISSAVSKIEVKLRPPIRRMKSSTDSISVGLGAASNVICDLTSSLPIKIEWFHESDTGKKTKIINSEKFRLSQNGSTLKITSTDLDNVGKYTCEASLISDPTVKMASTSNVQINNLSRPVFKNKSQEKITIASGHQVKISCKIAGGVPGPTLSWQVKSNGENVFKDLSISGEEMTIENATLADAGEYRCIAKNVRGQSVKKTDLIVLQAPIAFIGNKPVKSIPYGSNYEFTCEVKAYPLPNIAWRDSRKNKLDSQNVINKNVITSKLQIHNAKLSDTYECYAENNLGGGSDKVHLEVAPAITNGHKGIKDSTSVGLGAESNIICDLTSSLPIKIEWFHESDTGKKTKIMNSEKFRLSQNGSTLKITSTDLDNVGKYTCEASLISDPSVKMTSTSNVQINNLSRPVFKNKSQEKITIASGHQVKISCKIAGGVPGPTLSWQVKSNGENVFKDLSISGEEMTIEHATLADAGEYRCIAKNVRGESVKKTDLIVLQAPIAFIGNKPVKSIPYGSNYEFTCEVKAYPLPNIAWRDSRKNKLDSQNIINKNVITSKLQIYNAKLSDTYECYAENNLGGGSDKVHLEVAPAITKGHKGIKDSISVGLGAASNVICDLTSSIPIKIEWFHESDTGKKTKIINSEKFRLSQNGSTLKITYTDLDNVGKYTCEASLISDPSVKMTSTSNVQINNLSPPVFKKKSPEEITVESGHRVQISCKIAGGVPRPTVSWQVKSHDGNMFKDLPSLGEELVIEKVSLEDAGKYQCIAKNTEGVAVKLTGLIVKQAPVISVKKGPQKSIPYGSNHELTCEIKAFPLPNVAWKDSRGNKLDSQNIVSKNLIISRLKIHNAKISDSYYCHAENELGKDAGKVALTVDPAITNVGKHSEGIIHSKYGTDVNIVCELSSAFPIRIKWFHEKNTGKSEIQNSEKYVVSKNGSTLRIKSVNLDQTGKYTCEASLVSDPKVKKTFTTDVQIDDLKPPTFQSTALDRIEVVTNMRVNIQCKIGGGVPRPTVSWQFKMNAEDDFTNLPTTNEVLPVERTSLANAGFYRCIVTNNQGQINRTTELVVKQAPTALIDGDAKTTVPYGSTNHFSCRVTAYPVPNITWKDDKGNVLKAKDITTKDHVIVSRITVNNIKDNNTYTCYVENSLGRTESKVDVTVSSPFVVRKHPEAITNVHYGESKHIRCDISSAFPFKIKWYYRSEEASKSDKCSLTSSDGCSSEGSEVHSSDNFVISSDGSSLQITSMDLDLVGKYTCKAVLVSDERQKLAFATDVRIDDLRDPEINNTENVYYGVTGDVVLRIPCNATGVPKPTITWKQNDKEITSDSSKITIKNQAIYIKNPTEADSKNYTCAAKNVFGTVQRTFEAVVTDFIDNDKDQDKHIYLLPKDSKDIKCDIPHTDPKSVRWYLNSDLTSVRGSIYPLKDVSPINDGNYTCRVSTDEWATSQNYVVDVGFKPTFLIHYKSPVISWNGNKDHMLDCSVNAKPKETVKWFFNGKPLDTKDNSFNELPLTDWGEYACKVSNVHGSIQQTFNVTYLGCLINRTIDSIQNTPLLITDKYTWPRLPSENEFLTMESGEKVTLSCSTDEQPSNTFEKYSSAKKIEATCHKEDQFLVDGKDYKFKDLKCKEYVKASVVNTHEPCLQGNKVEVGFKLDGKFLDAYDLCYDEAKRMTLYTKVVMTDTNEGNKIEQSFIRNQDLWKHDDIVKCQYNQRYSVNPQDVAFGPAQIATLSQKYNAIQVYEPCEGSSMATWSEIEKTIRSSVDMFDSITVWTGGSHYDSNGVPRYLWKVLKYDESNAFDSIVYVNVPQPKKSDILCSFVAPSGIDFNTAANAYTCSIEEFLKAFNIPLSIINE